jgi:hypothetical protein
MNLMKEPIMSFGKSKTYKGPDRRRSPRERVSLRADIILATGRRIPCQIVDRSATGMRIALTSMLGIPDRFDLQVESAEPVDVFVVRRQTGEVFVSFLRPKALRTAAIQSDYRTNRNFIFTGMA